MCIAWRRTIVDKASRDRNYRGVERRRKPRIYDPIPLEIRGFGWRGTRYRFSSAADNLSAGGLCAAAPRVIKTGEKLFFLIRFSVAGSMPAIAPTIAARGRVLRTRMLPNGTSQFAAAFIHYRIL